MRPPPPRPPAGDVPPLASKDPPPEITGDPSRILPPAPPPLVAGPGGCPLASLVPSTWIVEAAVTRIAPSPHPQPLCAPELPKSAGT